MSREDTAMTFQEVYDSFQNDFHKTPQKIITFRHRNTHLKSTIESNNNNSTTQSNFKTMEEEEEQGDQVHSHYSNQIQVSHSINCTESHRRSLKAKNNVAQNNCNNTSPYDIQFDVLGNNLYESLQDCLTLTQQTSHHPVPLIDTHQPVIDSYPHPPKFKFESSLDSIYITENNFDLMEDEDKENKDPLEIFRLLSTAVKASTSPRQSSVQEHTQATVAFDSEKTDQREQAIELQEQDFRKDINYSQNRHVTFVDSNSHFTQNKGCNQINILTPLHRRYIKYGQQSSELTSITLVEKEDEEEDSILSNSNKRMSGTELKKEQYIQRDSSIDMQSGCKLQSQFSQIAYDGSLINNSYHQNDKKLSNNNLYEHHLLQSTTQTNVIIRRNLMCSTNRTPLRDITSSAISSAKKNYQGVKKMLEFSSPLINSWDLKTVQKQMMRICKQGVQNTTNKVACMPAILYR